MGSLSSGEKKNHYISIQTVTKYNTSPAARALGGQGKTGASGFESTLPHEGVGRRPPRDPLSDSVEPELWYVMSLYCAGLLGRTRLVGQGKKYPKPNVVILLLECRAKQDKG